MLILLCLSGHHFITTITHSVWKDSQPSSSVADCKCTIYWLCCAPCCEGLWGWRASTSQRWRQLILIITRTFSPARLAAKRATGLPFFSISFWDPWHPTLWPGFNYRSLADPLTSALLEWTSPSEPKNWGLVNIPTTCFSPPLCSPRCHLALYEVNCTLSDRYRAPHNARCEPPRIQFGLRDAEITALTWTSSRSVRFTSTSCWPFFSFFLFLLYF